jgi:DNA-binding PadR family transcriptional regulator
MLARVCTPSSTVRERERKIYIKIEKEGRREREREKERWRERESRIVIFYWNEGCFGTFKLSSLS